MTKKKDFQSKQHDAECDAEYDAEYGAEYGAEHSSASGADYETKYDVQYLKAGKGKFLLNVLKTTIVLFVVTVLVTWADHGKLPDFFQGLKLMGLIFLISTACWGAAYLYKKYFAKKQ